MLQQTQVKTVIPYYNRFLERFPDIESLAGAREEEVLSLWSGLGYYGRARNLHRAARLITEKYGEFPRDFEEILALPGVGRYTAGAISSIAFNEARPVVDGNIQRVLTRLQAIRRRPAAGHFWDLMSSLIQEAHPSSFNQAMMELGAMVCVPSQPQCPLCPVKSLCSARDLGIQNELPAARIKPPAKRVPIAVLVLEYRGRILLASANKLHFIPGKWGLPCRRVLRGETAEGAAAGLARDLIGSALPLKPAAKISHSISNYRITAHGFFGRMDRPIELPMNGNGFCWMDRDRDRELLTSSLFRKILGEFSDMRTKGSWPRD